MVGWSRKQSQSWLGLDSTYHPGRCMSFEAQLRRNIFCGRSVPSQPIPSCCCLASSSNAAITQISHLLPFPLNRNPHLIRYEGDMRKMQWIYEVGMKMIGICGNNIYRNIWEPCDDHMRSLWGRYEEDIRTIWEWYEDDISFIWGWYEECMKTIWG